MRMRMRMRIRIRMRMRVTMTTRMRMTMTMMMTMRLRLTMRMRGEPDLRRPPHYPRLALQVLPLLDDLRLDRLSARLELSRRSGYACTQVVGYG